MLVKNPPSPGPGLKACKASAWLRYAVEADVITCHTITFEPPLLMMCPNDQVLLFLSKKVVWKYDWPQKQDPIDT